MVGETNLARLLETLAPSILEGEFVFCTVKDGMYGDFSETMPIASFMEAEGLTLVLSKASADALGMDYESVFNCITLDVHSSLHAVGLTAVVATRLGEYGISANVIAAAFHDHVFVPLLDASIALRLLKSNSA